MIHFMKKAFNYSMVSAVIAALGVFVFISTGNFILSKNYVEKVSVTNGTVIGFDGKFIAIEFDKKIIKDKGDTEISAFLVDGNGINIQLKPIIIPEQKSKTFKDNKVMVFPINDIISLLEAKTYAIEIFIKNSKYASSSVGLPLIVLDLTGSEEKKDEKTML